MNTEYYLQKIKEERQYQDTKWGEQNHHPSVWVSIMGEEFGEMCKSLNEYMFEQDVNHFDDMQKEAIQVAAVVVAMLECFDRMGDRHRPEKSTSNHTGLAVGGFNLCPKCQSIANVEPIPLYSCIRVWCPGCRFTLEGARTVRDAIVQWNTADKNSHSIYIR